jgi:hypothetical protein
MNTGTFQTEKAAAGATDIMSAKSRLLVIPERCGGPDARAKLCNGFRETGWSAALNDRHKREPTSICFDFSRSASNGRHRVLLKKADALPLSYRVGGESEPLV